MTTSVSNAIPVGGDTCTDPGDTITVDLFVNWTSTASTRYDVGFWISTDGDAVNGNDACVGSTAPIGAGTAPNVFRNEDDPPQTGDTCGDVNSGFDPVVWPVRVTVPCQPAPGTDYLQVQACRAWQQNTGNVCKNLTDSGTGSKCDCEPLAITQVPVPRAATVTVIKDIVPNTDTEGRFNLYIDEGNNGSNDEAISDVGDNGQLGPHTVPAGTQANPGATHSVGETAGTGTSLGNYTSSITCVRAGGGTVGPVAGTSTPLTVQPDDNWTCTITNTAKPATIVVKKIAKNTAGVEYCPGRVFGFSLTPATTFTLKANLCAGSPFYTTTVNPGTYTIAETDSDINVPPNGWTLESIVCTNVAGTPVDASNWLRVVTPPLSSDDKGISGYIGANESVECIFANRQDSPLAVDLAFFTATPGQAGVALAWETVSETDNVGFNIYRAASEPGPWLQVNAALIPAAAPGSSEGHAYTWVDASAGAGPYVYALEDVALNGTKTRHTTVTTAAAVPNAVGLSGFGAATASAWPALGGLLAVVLAAAGAATVQRRKRN